MNFVIQLYTQLNSSSWISLTDSRLGAPSMKILYVWLLFHELWLHAAVLSLLLTVLLYVNFTPVQLSEKLNELLNDYPTHYRLYWLFINVVIIILVEQMEKATWHSFVVRRPGLREYVAKYLVKGYVNTIL